MSVFFEDNHPGRRKNDRHGWRRLVRENAYRDVWLLIISGVVCVALYIAVNASFRSDRNQRMDTQALCTLRNDLQRRIDSGNQFLVAYPHGFAGISATTIRLSIVNEQRTVNALRSLACH